MSIAWFIFITIVFMVGQSAIFKRWGFTRMTYSRSFNKESAFPGEEIEMVDEICNNKVLPIPWLRLESHIDARLHFLTRQEASKDETGDGFHKTLFSLFPYQKITRRHRIRCTKRGVYRLETVSMTLGDLIGLTDFHKYYHSEAMVVVYPELIPIEHLPLPVHSLLGEVVVRRWIVEDPFIRTGVRDYANGDPLKSVQWKATARTGRLQVSKKDYSADHQLMIYVNLDEMDDIWMPILNAALAELKISYAASIATYLISKGVSTGIGCNSDLVQPFGSLTPNARAPVRLEPSHKHLQLNHIYDILGKLSLERSMSFSYFLKEDVGRQVNTDFLIITSYVSNAMQEIIRSLENQGNKVNVLMVSDPLDGVEGNKGEGERQRGIQ